MALATTAATRPAQDGSFKVVYTFNLGGDADVGPRGDLVALNGLLYGATAFGGPGDSGTVYSLDPKTGTQKVIYAFGGFEDGEQPASGLIAVDGILYGTTMWGGPRSSACAIGCGVVYAIDPTTGNQRVVYSFLGGSDGAYPTTGLTAVGNVVYGTTSHGGTGGLGTVFAVDLSSGQETVLHSFQGGKDGENPEAGLTVVGSTLYGSTQNGGGSHRCQRGCGTVFSIDLQTGVEQVLHAFSGNTDGIDPDGALLQVGQSLYGVTAFGGNPAYCTYYGADGCGTIFTLDLKSNVERVVYTFQGLGDGSAPNSGFTAIGDTLYGAAGAGGIAKRACQLGCGAIYSFNTATGTTTILHDFSGGKAGAGPASKLVSIGHSLYGAAAEGGSNACKPHGCGLVFRITP